MSLSNYRWQHCFYLLQLKSDTDFSSSVSPLRIYSELKLEWNQLRSAQCKSQISQTCSKATWDLKAVRRRRRRKRGSVRVLRKRCDSQILLHQRTSWKKLWPDTHSGTQTIHTQYHSHETLKAEWREELRFAMNGTCQDMWMIHAFIYWLID